MLVLAPKPPKLLDLFAVLPNGLAPSWLWFCPPKSDIVDVAKGRGRMPLKSSITSDQAPRRVNWFDISRKRQEELTAIDRQLKMAAPEIGEEVDGDELRGAGSSRRSNIEAVLCLWSREAIPY